MKANNGMIALALVLGFLSTSFAKTAEEASSSMRQWQSSSPQLGSLPPCIKENSCNADDPQFKSVSRLPAGAPVADGQAEMVWCQKCGRYIHQDPRLADATAAAAGARPVNDAPAVNAEGI